MDTGPISREVGAISPEERVAGLRRQLLASVRRSCPAWLADQAEDIVQTAMVRLIGVLEKGGENLELNPSYLKRVAYNATVDEMRRQMRQKEVTVEERAELERVPARSAHPERSVAALEIHEGICDCLGGMIRSRRIALACHLQGYSVPESARFLGWTRKKTEHLIRRGLMDLRTCLAGKGLTP